MHETPVFICPKCKCLSPVFIGADLLVLPFGKPVRIQFVFGNIYPDGVFHKSFSNFVLSCRPTAKNGARVSIPLADRRCMHRREAGHKKRRRRPYSATVHDDQEGSGPTSAAAWHKCRAGQLFQLRTGTAQFIRQEGGPVWGLSFSGF
jgi:hypothetical protein